MKNSAEILEGCTIEEIEAFLKVSKAIIEKPEAVKSLPINYGVRPRVQMILRMLKTIMIGKPNVLSNVVYNGGKNK